MEPNKIENQIREKLNAREIQPSAHSWDRLDAMLSVQEETPKKVGFPWMKIAAGLVLFLGIAFAFLTQNGSQEQPFQNNKGVVASPTKEQVIITNNTTEVVQNDATTQSEIAKETMVTGNPPSNRNLAKKQELYSPQMTVKGQENTTSVATVEQEKTDPSQSLLAKNEMTLPIENKEVIAANKTISKSKLKVDASALLNQVEGEVTLTFRQKVMKTMVKNYKDAKESFASRNLEESSNN